MGRLRAVLLLLAILASASPAGAVLPDEVLADPALEARARDLSAELRCMVCQNQSIDDSDAPLARDLRLLLRDRLAAGDTDDEVMQFLVARYGDFILLKPRIAPHTVLLWATPVLVLILGAGLALALFRRNRPRPVTDRLTAEEDRKLRAILAEKPAGNAEG